eukprot:449210_1
MMTSRVDYYTSSYIMSEEDHDDTTMELFDEDNKNKATMELFDIRARQKQQLIFDNYFTSNITPYINNIRIPKDISGLIYRFYELTVALLLPNTYENIQHMDELYCAPMALLLCSNHSCFIAYDMVSFFLQYNPNSGTLHVTLANVLSRWNSFVEAETEYNIAIVLEPKNNNFKYKFGGLLQKQHKHDLALEQFLLASKNNPDQPEYYFEAAYCYQMLKQFDKAIENYDKCITMNPNRADYYEYYADYLSSENINLKQAEQYFEKAIKLKPDRWHIYYSYGRCLRDYFVNYEKSKEIYLKAIELKPNKGFIHGSYGYLLYLMGEYDESRISLETAVDLDPERVFSHYYKSLLLRKLNCKQEAEKELIAAVNVTTIPKAVLVLVQEMQRINPEDIEYHRKFEILLRAKYTATNLNAET